VNFHRTALAAGNVAAVIIAWTAAPARSAAPLPARRNTATVILDCRTGCFVTSTNQP
jgi:hypothetical protein